MKIHEKRIGLAAIAAITMAGLVHGAPAQKPNIVLFVNDDRVKEEVGCYGGKVLSPHLDRLAREGMRMDNAHVVSTVCTRYATPCSWAGIRGTPGSDPFGPSIPGIVTAHPVSTWILKRTT